MARQVVFPFLAFEELREKFVVGWSTEHVGRTIFNTIGEEQSQDKARKNSEDFL